MLAERRQRRRDGRGWEWAYNVANLEYTEFERLGVPDEAAAGSALSRFPANTNVLYVGLQARHSRLSVPCFMLYERVARAGRRAFAAVSQILKRVLRA